jgi:hypothetical protein
MRFFLLTLNQQIFLRGQRAATAVENFIMFTNELSVLIWYCQSSAKSSTSGSSQATSYPMNPLKRSFTPAWRPLAAVPLLLPALTLIAGAQTVPDNSKAASAAEAKPEEVVILSPFQVTTDTRGYYSANTMSGTRFNAKLDDLASSITVVTKQQMSDFAMLDANDVFLYTAGTDGTGTYTDYTLDRNGSIGDNVALNPTQANRVRGLAPANVSLGNIETMGRVPLDPIIVDSIEISRGPNANVFGLGNPSGTLNEVPASANVQRDHTYLEYRTDSWGGSRAAIDFNQVVSKDHFAIRGSAVNQWDGFTRKPSGVRTERYNLMMTFRPTSTTTITGSMFTYHAYGNRPNALPPRDNLSYWLASGSPTWDPVTQQIHIHGVTVATVPAATYNGPDYFSATYLGNSDGQLYIDPSGATYWASPRGTTSTAGPTLATQQAARYLQPTAAAGPTFSGTAPRPFNQPLFNTTPTISDKSIYDWSSINLDAPNYFNDNTKTYNLQLDQVFLHSAMQTLALEVTFMREDSDRLARNLVDASNDNGQSGQLTVDINERLLDGSPNPYFLRPYIASDKPRTVSQPARWDTERGQLAYRLDLTQLNNPLKYLGWFQLTGYAEHKLRINRQYSYRDGIVSNPSWLPAGLYRGFQSSPTGTPAQVPVTQELLKFYVGDNQGHNVDYAPGGFSYGDYPFVWGNAATGAFNTENLTLGQEAADKTGGTFNTKVAIKTLGTVLQNHFLDDHLVTTVGIRHDSTLTNFGYAGSPTNAFLNSDGLTFNTALTDAWDPTDYNNGGQTTNFQGVLRPFANTSIAKNLEAKGGGEHFLGDLLNGLSLTYNRSDSFLPTQPAQDLFKNLLPNTTGTDKSWGINLNLFDGKLVVRATHYDDFLRNAQTTDVNTIAGRVLRMDFPVLGAGAPTGGLNLVTNATRWVLWQHPTWTTDQVNTEVQKETGFGSADTAYYSNATPPIGATSDVQSKGTEIEINYNPTPYWTVSGSVTKTNSTTLNVSSALVDWIDERESIWSTIVDPSITTASAIAENNPNKLWWLHHYTSVAVGSSPANGTPASYTSTAQTPQQNFQAFVQAPFAVIAAQEGKNNPQIAPYAVRFSTAFQLSGVTDNRYLKAVTVGGAVRWQDKAAIGYYGVQQLPATITDLDPNRPIYNSPHTYVDMFAAYRFKIWHDKVVTTLKLNVRNVGQRSGLQPVGAFPDGTISTYRIVDPQLFIFTASFDL